MNTLEILAHDIRGQNPDLSVEYISLEPPHKSSGCLVIGHKKNVLPGKMLYIEHDDSPLTMRLVLLDIPVGKSTDYEVDLNDPNSLNTILSIIQDNVEPTTETTMLMDTTPNEWRIRISSQHRLDSGPTIVISN